jgi:micrococcal nuclease
MVRGVLGVFEYPVKIVRVVDGDTVDVDIDLGFGIWIHKERIRLLGIDTPESRTRDKVEKIFGKLASQFLKESLGKTSVLRTSKDKSGKFGRILGEFIVDGESINQVMVAKRLAVRYHGQSKDDVEDEHLKNREYLIEKGIVKL